MSNEREEFQAWRLDFESDYDRKPTFLEVWQACAERKQREIEALAAQAEMMQQERDTYLTELAKIRDAAGAWHVHPEAIGDPLEVYAKVAALAQERDALAAQNERMREALEDTLAQASGTKKHCGHDFECVCPGDKARAALSLPAHDCLKERDARKAAEALREAAEKWNKEANRFSTAYGFLNTLAAAKERGE